MEPNFVTLNTPYYRRLSDSQIQILHDGTLEVLERTGIRILEEEALQLFRKGGADVTDGTRVRIPAWRVEWAIKTAPKQIILYDQEGRPAIRLRGRNCYYGNGSDLVNIIDHRSNERRPATSPVSFRRVREKRSGRLLRRDNLASILLRCGRTKDYGSALFSEEIG